LCPVPQFQTFKDLSITFRKHPITDDLIVVKGDAAIKQAVVNLLLTNRGERLFNSEIGSGITNLLFEPLDYGTAALVNAEITRTLEDYEPRIRIETLTVVPNFEDNGFEVGLEFEVVGRDDLPLNVEFFLERSR